MTLSTSINAAMAFAGIVFGYAAIVAQIFEVIQ